MSRFARRKTTNKKKKSTENAKSQFEVGRPVEHPRRS
jgi:hypothetical protein